MMLAHPGDLFDRREEWSDLSRFVTAKGGGLRVAVVHGRRRQGKSYLLRRLAAATGGFYHQALQEEAKPALERLGGAMGEWLKVPGGRLALANWSEAVDAIAALGADAAAPVLVVIDELPYLLEQVPELSSLLQRAVDGSRDREAARVRLVLCGSALSVMSGLLSGQRALRGRVLNTIRIDPFDFRDAASYWGLAGSWQLALRMHAILGGTPGYRDLAVTAPPREPGMLGSWLADGVLSPASSLFREDEYLLAEERGLNDRALYHSVLSAIAAGCHTEAKIATVLGRDRQSLHWPLRTLMDAGLVVREQDALRQRRPSYRIAEPIVRFHHLITRRDMARLEERRAREVWRDAQSRFRSQILGPHFEDLARRWTARFASESSVGGRLATVGATQVSDPAGRSQLEVDVVGIRAGEIAEVALLGEAKLRSKPVGVDVLARLEHARELLARRVTIGRETKLIVFSAGGFQKELVALARKRSGEVELVDLARLYTGR